MEVIEYKAFDRENREILSEFIKGAENDPDELSGSVIATMTHFILNLRETINEIREVRNWLTSIEIIDSQVQELRRCVIDLEAYKGRLIKGETKQ